MGAPQVLSDVVHHEDASWGYKMWRVDMPGQSGGTSRWTNREEAVALAKEWWPDLENDMED